MSMTETEPKPRGGYRPNAGPRSVAIADRKIRQAFAQRCTAKYEEIVQFFEARFMDTSLTFEERKVAADWLVMRGFGRVIQPMEARVDVEHNQTQRMIYEVRWLPPDSNDHSKVIEAEPDVGRARTGFDPFVNKLAGCVSICPSPFRRIGG